MTTRTTLRRFAAGAVLVFAVLVCGVLGCTRAVSPPSDPTPADRTATAPGAVPPTPDAPPPGPTTGPTTGPDATPAAPSGAPDGTDRTALWRRWQTLNDTCRGTNDAGTARACAERDTVQRAQAFAAAADFLAAWRARDPTALRALAHPDNRADAGRVIPADLLALVPAEDRFDCRYDLDAAVPFGCYIHVRDQPTSLYFAWDTTWEKGWLVRGYAPDV